MVLYVYSELSLLIATGDKIRGTGSLNALRHHKHIIAGKPMLYFDEYTGPWWDGFRRNGDLNTIVKVSETPVGGNSLS